jgi:galactitol-specific phosphotransferase system IIC component
MDTFSMLIPLGVTAGLCQFIFPEMIHFWMFPLATVSGNKKSYLKNNKKCCQD